MITYPKLNMDSLGICASTLCMVHCLLFPLLLAAMPLLSLSAGAVQNTPPTGQQTPVRTASEIPNMMLSADSPPCCPRGGRSPASGHNTPGCCSTPLDYWFHVGMLAEATREHRDVLLGLSPRGLLTWQRLAQAEAHLRGRDFVTPDDVQRVAGPVLSVRLTGEFESPQPIIDDIVGQVSVPVLDGK